MAAEKRILCVGRGADPGRVAARSAGIERALFLELTDAERFRAAVPGIPAETVAFDPRIQQIEREAWRISERLVDEVARIEPALAAPVRVYRRMLTSEVLMPPLKARAEVELLAQRVPEGLTVVAEGFSPQELTAFRAVLAGRALEAGPPAARSLTRDPTTAARAVARWARDLLRVPARSAARRRAREFARTGEPRALLLAGAEAHERVLAGPTAELERRGWRLLEVDREMAGQGSRAGLVPGRVPYRHYRWTTLGDVLGFATGRPLLPASFFSEEGLAGYEGWVLSHVSRRARLEGVAVLRGIRRLLSDAAPDAVLTVSETGPEVEATGTVGREVGVATVNVQHGIIIPTPLRSEFPFDAFCLFGEAYREVMLGLGNDPASVVVTGDPRLDSVGLPGGPRATAVPPCAVAAGERLVLFIGQHAMWRISEKLLFDTLAAVLDAVGSIPGAKLGLKLHPVGEGKEAGYEAALAASSVKPCAALRRGDLLGMLASSDAVVTFSSSSGFEAAALKRPLLVVNLTGSADEVPFAKEGVALAAHSAEEVAPALERLLSGEFAPGEEAYRRFDERYHHKLDGRASARIADVVERLSSR